MIPNKTGLVVKGKCDTSLLLAMKALTQDMKKSREMGLNARSYAEERSFETAFLQTWEMFGNIEQPYGMAASG